MSDMMWGGRFQLPFDEFAEEFGSEYKIEPRIYNEDIDASKVHARMLAKQGIVSQADVDKILEGLEQVRAEFREGKLTVRPKDEDIHMAVERRLTQLIGEPGGRLHTARSRNDQGVVDGVVHMRKTLKEVQGAIRAFQKVLLEKAKANMDAIMPGYTHLQTAQPILFAHWIMAYFQMLQRDYERMQFVWDHTHLCPLGSAALAGTDFNIDRHFTARELGFDGPTENSLDSVCDMDYVLEFASAAAICHMHLTRMCEEIVIFSSQDFKFFELSDDFCTGSSIMPQKKNPDMAELIRGKGGRMIGNLTALLVMVKGIPLTYNKDLQEVKPLTFEVIDNLTGSLRVMTPMVEKMALVKNNMRHAAARGYSTATDMADYLVRKGLPFREAHRVTGETVHYCIEKGKMLNDLMLDEFRQFYPDITEDIYQYITVEASVGARKSYGGTSPESVAVQIANAEKKLAS